MPWGQRRYSLSPVPGPHGTGWPGIGPRALGLAAEMKHGLGVPYRKVGQMLDKALGLRVAPILSG
jgi:hypothetical protein